MRLLFLVLLTSFATGVRAEEAEPAGKAEARALLAEGNARFAAGDMAAALTDFRRAFSLFPSPKLLVNTAACEEQLGRTDDAASDLDEFLRRFDRLAAPTDDERRLAGTAQDDLQRLRPELGRIEWTNAPAGATLEVDGQTTWLVRWVKPGEHHVIQRVGADTRRSTETITAGQIVTLDFAAQKLTVSPTPEHRRRRPWLIPVAVAGGVVVVGLALGLGLGLGLHHADSPHGDKTAGFTF